jgi:membrane protease YdiL (CAAX protease family)
MAMTRLAPAQAIVATVFSVCVTIVLGESYQCASQALSPEWLAAGAVNSFLAALAFAYLWHKDRDLLSPGVRLAYVPALIVLCGSMLLAKLTANGDTMPVDEKQTLYFVASFAWVPIIEELVFRGGIGRMLRPKIGPLWAAWFSALIFTMVHGTPTLERALNGQVGFALGAFLLGICCEALLYFSGSLLPGIAFHAACNATVMIFGVINPRWLDWLGPLYLK